MDPQSASPLWMGGFLLLIVGMVAVAIVVLRTPVALLNLRTKVSALEAQVALMDSVVKKAARRAGIAERKARETETASEVSEPLNPPSETGLPLGAPPGPGASRDEQLRYAEQWIQRHGNGG
jgi:hypothetical protein